ncbi:MAG: YadA C-terminal domain-containing protein [Vibrio splendidus]
MKKTILAVAISVASFNASATVSIPTEPTDPVVSPIFDGSPKHVNISNQTKVNAVNAYWLKSGNTNKLEIVDGELLVTDVYGTSRPVTEQEINDARDEAAQHLAENAGKVITPPVFVEPIDPGFGNDPIDVEIPIVEPIAGNPDAIKAHAKKIVNDFQVSGSNEEKELVLSHLADSQGYDVTVDAVSTDGVARMTFTDRNTGDSVVVTESEFKEYMSKKQKERSAERQEESAPIVMPNPVLDGLTDKAAELKESYTGEIAEQAQAQTQTQIDELYALGNQNATDINTLFNEVDRLDSKIDGVAAMSQASLAARPYLSTNQTSSVGVGIGGAGSEAAFALGYAHRMTENWTANANVAVNTGDSAEASYGAGVSYAW